MHTLQIMCFKEADVKEAILKVKPAIGLLGLADRSTRYYLQQLNSQYNDLYGGDSTCRIKLLNVNFELINPFLPDDFERLMPVTRRSLIELAAMDIDQIILPNITLHNTIDQLSLEKELYDKIVHPLRLLGEVVKSRNIDEVRLLGTRHKSHGDYISNFLADLRVKVTFPSQEQLRLNEALRCDIYSQSDQGHQLTELYAQVNQYLNDADGPIVIACTELSIAWAKAQQMNDVLLDKFRIIDLSLLQIDAAIERFDAINHS